MDTLSTGAKPQEPPLLAEVMGRLESVRNNMLDTIMTMESLADTTFGVESEVPAPASTPLPRFSGAAGAVLEQVIQLETMQRRLAAVYGRFRILA